MWIHAACRCHLRNRLASCWPHDLTSLGLSQEPASAHLSQSVSADLPCFHVLAFNLSIDDWCCYSIHRSTLCCNRQTTYYSQRLTLLPAPSQSSIILPSTPTLTHQPKGKPATPLVRPGPYHGLHKRTRAGSKSRTCFCCCCCCCCYSSYAPQPSQACRGGLHSGLVGRQYLELLESRS